MAEELERLGVSCYIVPQAWMIFARANRLVLTVNCLLNAGPVRRLCEIIARENIDVVYSNSAVIFGGGVAARLTGRAHVWHLHELVGSNPRFTFGFGLKILKACLRTLSDQIVVVSSAVAADLGLTELADEVAVVPNGLPPGAWEEPELGDLQALRTELGLPAGRRVLLFLANLGPGKRPERAIAALAALGRTDIQLLMVGNPGRRKYMRNLQSLAEGLGVSEQVTFAGYRADVRRILALADVSLVPNEIEAWGLATAEAMAAGVPVVAGNNLDLIEDGRTGFLVEPGNAAAMAEKVALLLDDAGLRQRMGEAARESTRQYTVARQLAGVAAALDRAAAAPVRRWTLFQLLRQIVR
ncbi:MAG: glycosyltransferase family 4 protein, partial [Chitinophagales bacterium]